MHSRTQKNLLSDGSRSTLTLVARQLLPANNPCAYDWEDIDFFTPAEQFCAASPFNRLGLWLALTFIDWLAPFLVQRKIKRFAELTSQWQWALLERLHHHHWYWVRGLFLIAHTVLQFAYYSDERVLRKLRYYNHLPDRNKADGFLPEVPTDA